MGTIIEKEARIGSRKMKFVVERYDSSMDVVKDCRTRMITSSRFEDKSKETFGSWEGVRSYEEALNLLENGYQPTVDKMKEKIRNCKSGYQKRMRIENNVVGGAPIVASALMGLPKSMLDTKIRPIKCKVIDIYYDLTCSCGTDSDDIIKNGQKLLGAIIELERLGYKFNLYAVQSYSDSESADILVVKIKSSNQPLDLKRMSFPLTHTAFFRVMGFDWYSRCPKAHYRSGYGSGLSYKLNSKEQKEFANKILGENAFYISGKEIMYNDEEHIKEVLEEHGKGKR